MLKVSTSNNRLLSDAKPETLGRIPGMGVMLISLREITADTVHQITSLSVSPEQQRFVASNAISLAQALFSPDAWYRAIYAGESPAGFVMLYDESMRASPPLHPQVALWRFMVDSQFQRRGVGTTALDQ